MKARGGTVVKGGTRGRGDGTGGGTGRVDEVTWAPYLRRDMADASTRNGGAGGGEAREAADEGFDRVIERLRGVVERLEGGSLTLEQSLQAFEEGVRLSRRGSEVLDRAERRVELLSRGPDGSGGDVTMPFEAPPGERGGGAGGGDAGA